MNNAHVFIARLVRGLVRLALAPAQKIAGVTVGGRVFELPFAEKLPSVASGFLRSCRNDGGGRSRT